MSATPQTPPAPLPTAGDSTSSRRRKRGWVWLGVFLALLVYAASGFYFVQPDERGVVRWFGRVPANQKGREVNGEPIPGGVPSGLHYALPWPFCQVQTPRTTEVRRVYVGLQPEMREAIAQGETWAMQASPPSDVLTGDVNILKVTMAVQYEVVDPVAYLFATQAPDELVGSTAKGVLIDLLATVPVDRALTAGKKELETETQRRAGQLLDEYGCGVRLVDTTIESFEPPQAIAAAFKEVVSAKQDGDTKIDQANAQANRILPRARGDASTILEEARSYAQARVSRAIGEADRFLALLTEYQRAPRVTADRLRLQAFEKALKKARLYVLDQKTDEEAPAVRIIDRIE